jgi:amino acid permease
VTALWMAVVAKKSFMDITGNGVNHPNDYGHRLYAMLLASTLGCWRSSAYSTREKKIFSFLSAGSSVSESRNWFQEIISLLKRLSVKPVKKNKLDNKNFTFQKIFKS